VDEIWFGPWEITWGRAPDIGCLLYSKGLIRKELLAVLKEWNLKKAPQKYRYRNSTDKKESFLCFFLGCTREMRFWDVDEAKFDELKN
jgi:hypothetical protein